MNANDVIESYVTDVALQLPREQRDDVAFELRALLHEELEGKAAAAGHDAGAAMATELVRAFGRPEDVASRYRPTLTIIDPADGRRFVRASAIGLATIWGLGLWACLRQPIASGSDLLLALGRWWGAAVIPSLWWPGVLVVSFGLGAWARRRWPQASEWKPRPTDRVPGGRAAMALGLVAMLCGIFVLLNPRAVLEFFFGGRVAPAAYAALTYTETFRQRQAPYVIALVMLNVPMLISAIVNGRRSAIMRRVEVELSLVICAVLAWAVVDGPIFVATSSDRMAKSLIELIIAFTLIGVGVKLRRNVSPSPNEGLGALEKRVR